MKRVPDINVIFKRRKFFKMWFVSRSGLISKTSLQQQQQPSLPLSPSAATASRNLAISVMCFKWNVVEKSVWSACPCFQHGPRDKALICQEFTRKLQGNSSKRLFYQVTITLAQSYTSFCLRRYSIDRI